MATIRNRKAIAKALIDYNAFIGENAYDPTYIDMLVDEIEQEAIEARALEEQEVIEMPKLTKEALWAKHTNIPRVGVPGSDLNPARGIYLNYLKESNRNSIWSLKRFWRSATATQRGDAVEALGVTFDDVDWKISEWEEKFLQQNETFRPNPM